MDLQHFVSTHLPALERDEARFNVLIAVLSAAARNPSSALARWTVGAAGHCAVRSPGRPILLGQLDEAECRRLAQDAIDEAGAGVVGADDTAHWFAEHAVSLGAKLGQPIPQRIHVLSHPPRYPQAAGSARPATADDASLLHAWLSAFRREATPHDPPPSREDAEKAAHSGRFLLWTVDGEPVAMAAVNRSLRHTGAIGAVYTPPEHRGRGYAGSVTAAVADRIPRRRQDQRLPPHGPAQPGVQPLLREDRVRRLLRGPALSAGQLCRLSPERGGLGPSAVPATNR